MGLGGIKIEKLEDILGALITSNMLDKILSIDYQSNFGILFFADRYGNGRH